MKRTEAFALVLLAVVLLAVGLALEFGPLALIGIASVLGVFALVIDIKDKT